jgi:hypothetical protein
MFLAGLAATSLAGCGCGSKAESGQAAAPDEPAKGASAEAAEESDGSAQQTEPQSGDETTEEDAAVEAPLPRDVEVFSLTAEEFFREHRRNRTATVQKYQDGVVELKGVVGIVERDVGGAPMVSLQAMDDPVGVKCLTKDPQPWAQVAPGQEVTVRGRVPDFDVGPTLEDCRLTAQTFSPAVKIDAEKLAAEAAADPVAAMAKYRDKHVVIRGQVAEKREEQDGSTRVVLAGQGEIRVVCRFPPFEKPRADALQAGGPLRALGRCKGMPQPGEVLLEFCLLIE